VESLLKLDEMEDMDELVPLEKSPNAVHDVNVNAKQMHKRLLSFFMT
jgi:hypothetical protein